MDSADVLTSSTGPVGPVGDTTTTVSTIAIRAEPHTTMVIAMLKVREMKACDPTTYHCWF